MATTLLDFTAHPLPLGKASLVPDGKVKVPPRPAAKPPAKITVDGIEIAEDTIRDEAQHHPAATPNAAFAAAARALVVRALLLKQAAARNIVVEPEMVVAGKRETDEEAAIRGLLDAEVQTPRADTAACRRYYDANPQKFCSESLYEARHILFAAPLSDAARRQQAKAQAEAVLALLVAAPARFAELALDHSACPSKGQGGSLGQLTKGSTVPEFEAALFKLEAGQLAPAPVSSQFGYHIIQLDRIVAGRQLPFHMVEARIAAWLEASSWSRAVAQYVSILASQADITGIDMNAADGPLVQ